MDKVKDKVPFFIRKKSGLKQKKNLFHYMLYFKMVNPK